MKCHQPIIKTVESQFNHRKISVPVFSFVDQAVSLLTSDLLTPEYLIDGYAIFSGTRCQHFWNPASIDDSDTMSIPTPTDPMQKISDIHSSYLFGQPFPVSAQNPIIFQFTTKPTSVDKETWPLHHLFSHLDSTRVAGVISHPSSAFLAICLTFLLGWTRIRRQTKDQLSIVCV